ncbi:MAG: tetratricopeptide repeat protein [Pyrinomonadaceae bacterium]
MSPALAQVQSSLSIQSAAESAARAVGEKYFTLYSAKDLDRLMSLWSEKSPDYASLKQKLQRQFATADYISSVPTISRVRVDGEKASLRATVNVSATDPKTYQKREQQTVHNFVFVREEGNWKVWRHVPAENDLAEALVKAETEAERAGLLAEEKELVTVELVRALGSQGERFQGQGNYPQALATHRLAHKLAGQLGDKTGLARALNSLGIAHWAQGDYAPALQNFQQSLALSQMLNDQAAVAGTLRNLGNLQYVQGNWDQAAELFRQGLRLSETLGDRLGVARGLGSLGVVADSQGDYPQALAYYRQCLEQFQALADNTGIARTLGNIAIVYEEQGNYAQALAYHQKSLALFEAKGDQAGGARTLHNIAIVHLDQGKLRASAGL